jgi:hypothetical protein
MPQLNTYTNVNLTKVEEIRSKSTNEGIGFRGFMKVSDEEGRYQFGRAFVVWTQTASEFEDMKKKVSLRRIALPGNDDHQVAYRRVAAVTGYHKDKLTNGRWYNNFVIQDVIEADLPEQVVLELDVPEQV